MVFNTITSNPVSNETEPDTRFLTQIIREMIRDSHASESLEQDSDSALYSLSAQSLPQSNHSSLYGSRADSAHKNEVDPSSDLVGEACDVSAWDTETVVHWMRRHHCPDVRAVADRFEELQFTGIHLQAFADEEDLIREELQVPLSETFVGDSYYRQHYRSLSLPVVNPPPPPRSSMTATTDDIDRIRTMAQCRRAIFNAFRALCHLPLAPADADLAMLCCPAPLVSASSSVTDLEGSVEIAGSRTTTTVESQGSFPEDS